MLYIKIMGEEQQNTIDAGFPSVTVFNPGMLNRYGIWYIYGGLWYMVYGIYTADYGIWLPTFPSLPYVHIQHVLRCVYVYRHRLVGDRVWETWLHGLIPSLSLRVDTLAQAMVRDAQVRVDALATGTTTKDMHDSCDSSDSSGGSGDSAGVGAVSGVRHIVIGNTDNSMLV
jgi:hypothetical protein